MPHVDIFFYTVMKKMKKERGKKVINFSFLLKLISKKKNKLISILYYFF